MKNATVVFLFVLLYLCSFCRGEIYAIKFDSQFFFQQFEDVAATFGPSLSKGVRGLLVVAEPLNGCKEVAPPPKIDNNTDGEKWILIVPRFTQEVNCSFEQKVRVAQSAGYNALIVHNVDSEQLIPMYAVNRTNIEIPSVFVSESTGLTLRGTYANPNYFLVVNDEAAFDIKTHLLIPFGIVVGVCFIVMIIFMIVKCIKDRRRQRRHRLPASSLNKIPTRKFQKGDPYETCAICLDDFIEGEKLRVLPCNHVYHCKCIDPWLTKNRRVCPICKRKVFAGDERPDDVSDSDSDSDDTAPLITSSNRGTQGGTFVQQTENPLQRAQLSISQQIHGLNALMTASERHSINADHRDEEERNGSSSSSSSSSSSMSSFLSTDNNFKNLKNVEDDDNKNGNSKEESGASFLDSLEVQVHGAASASSSGSRSRNFYA